MPFLAPGVEAPPYEVVLTVRGRAVIDGKHTLVRVFLTVDRTLIVCTADTSGSGEILRQTFQVLDATWSAPLLTVDTAEAGQITVDASGCGCNMGAVGNTGPVEGAYRLVKVRNPEWLTVG